MSFGFWNSGVAKKGDGNKADGTKLFYDSPNKNKSKYILKMGTHMLSTLSLIHI